MEFLEKLGINFWLLLGQVVNFLILLLILTKFAFKPLLKVLDERSKKISQSLKEAEEIKEKLKAADNEYDKKLILAKKEVSELLTRADNDADKLREQKIKETKEQIAQILEEGKLALGREKEQTLRAAKQELGGLVAEVAAKVLGEKLNGEEDKKLIEKVLRELKIKE